MVALYIREWEPERLWLLELKAKNKAALQSQSEKFHSFEPPEKHKIHRKQLKLNFLSE